jgi:RNA-directed DNA polymerase
MPWKECSVMDERLQFVASTSSCIPRKRAYWSSDHLRSGAASGVERGDLKRSGRFTVLRQTVRKRLQAKLNEVKAELRRRMHHPIPEVGQWLRSVVDGHNRYYGVPMNDAALLLFRLQVGRLWHRALSRRSQNGHVPWDRMHRLIAHWLHPVRIYHPYPLCRMGVVT